MTLLILLFSSIVIENIILIWFIAKMLKQDQQLLAKWKLSGGSLKAVPGHGGFYRRDSSKQTLQGLLKSFPSDRNTK